MIRKYAPVAHDFFLNLRNYFSCPLLSSSIGQNKKSKLCTVFLISLRNSSVLQMSTELFELRDFLKICVLTDSKYEDELIIQISN